MIKRALFCVAVGILSVPMIIHAKDYTENVRSGYSADVIERTYQTDNKDEQLPFDNKYNGKKLFNVKYEVTDSVQETTEEEKIQNKTYKDLESDKKSEIPDTITVSGEEYKLSDVIFKKQDTEEHVSYKQQLGYSVTEPKDYPKTYDYTYVSPVSKEEVTVSLPFSHLEKGEEGWKDGFSVQVTLQNLDGEDFDLGGSTYSYTDSDSPDFSEKDFAALVRKLGYKTDEYRLTSAVWSGKPYEKNGVISRNAICYGQQYGAMYEAVYADDVVNKELYSATATYTNTSEKETGKTIYTIKATAIYRTGMINAVTVSAAIILLVVAVILSLYSVSKKKKISNSNKLL